MPHRYLPIPGDHDPAHWLRHAMANLRLALRVFESPKLPPAARLDALDLIARSAEDCCAALDAMDRRPGLLALGRDPLDAPPARHERIEIQRRHADSPLPHLPLPRCR